MRILATDTSTKTGSVALLDDTRLVCEWTLRSRETHNRRLLQTIESCLKASGWSLSEVDGFAVTSGPGSFTGLRIGLTTVKTLAWTLGKPFVAICTLDVLAASLSHASLPICCLVDAYRNEVFWAFYRPDGRGGVQLAGSHSVSSIEAVMQRIHGPTLFCGDGWLANRAQFEERFKDWVVGAPAETHCPRAGVLARLASGRFSEQTDEDPVTSVPFYVRPSEAELNQPSRGSP